MRPVVPHRMPARPTLARCLALAGLLAPAIASAQLTEDEAVQRALARPEVRDAFGKLAFEPRSSTPEELSAFVAEQLEAYRSVTRAVGLSLD